MDTIERIEDISNGSYNVRRIGEVVESTTSEFTAQTHLLYDSPPLGSLVRCGDVDPVYAVVAEVSTRSIDPSRRPTAIGSDEQNVEALYSKNPQIKRLLSTEFRSLVVAHAFEGDIRFYLSPTPTKIHDFVCECTTQEILNLRGPSEFLPVLLNSPIGSPDDVTAYFLRRVSQTQPDPDSYLLEAGRQLAVLLNGQLHRLNGILRRISP